jgi:O-antigen/teichoic acid export membrane protein
MHFDLKPILNSNNISITISQVIWVIANISIGKLIALFVAPEIFGRYNLEFGLVTFAFTLLITPVAEYFKTKVPKLNSHRKYIPFFIGYASLAALFSLLISLILLYFNQNLAEVKYVLIVLSYFLFTTGYTYTSHYLNVRGKLVALAKFNIIKSLAHVVAIAIGVYFIPDSATILWAAIILSDLIPFLIFIKKRFHKLDFIRPPKAFLVKYSKELLDFSFPLILMSLALWANNYADRYILEYFYSKYEVGIYNAGYSLGSKVFITLSPIFLFILTPKIYNLPKDTFGENKANRILSRYTLYYAVVGILIVFLVFVLKDFIGRIFLSETYRESFKLIPWIALGYLFLTMSVHINTKFYAFSKTNWLLYINILSAVINLVSNFILIPKHGILGAALSTTISFTAGFLVTFILMQRKIFK